MKVTTEDLGGEGMDAIVVRLDDGTELGAYCIVSRAEEERANMERMIQACIDEALDAWLEAQEREEEHERRIRKVVVPRVARPWDLIDRDDPQSGW